jgi:hypothetical protein
MGCGDDGEPLSPDGPPDGPPGPLVWSPAPGEAKNWDIQIHAPFDLSAQRAMYVVELFQVVPSATTLTYADNSTVTVPAGGLPTAIADLHAASTIVVCRVGTGAIRLDDPDASKFPGFEASPPNDPDLPAAGSVIGWSTLDPNEPNERFLDQRQSARSLVTPLIEKRFELAKQIGCDAIDADKTLIVGLRPGFDVSPDEILSFNLAVAALSKTPTDTAVSIGLRNGFFIAADEDIMEAFEFQIMEGLGANRDCCDELRPFLDRGRAAFALDLMSLITVDEACAEYGEGNMQDGLIKDDAYSSAFRGSCP